MGSFDWYLDIRFFYYAHDEFVTRKFLICIVQALENQVYTVIWSLPSSFFLDTQRKPFHTRNLLIIVMFMMIMTIQRPGQCNSFLCFIGSSSWFLVAVGWSSFSMVLPAGSSPTRNWWEETEENGEADEEALIITCSYCTFPLTYL